jgi:hypothetical protein
MFSIFLLSSCHKYLRMKKIFFSLSWFSIYHLLSGNYDFFEYFVFNNSISDAAILQEIKASLIENEILIIPIKNNSVFI